MSDHVKTMVHVSRHNSVNKGGLCARFLTTFKLEDYIFLVKPLVPHSSFFSHLLHTNYEEPFTYKIFFFFGAAEDIYLK